MKDIAITGTDTEARQRQNLSTSKKAGYTGLFACGESPASAPFACQALPVCTIFMAEAIRLETSDMLPGTINVVVASRATWL